MLMKWSAFALTKTSMWSSNIVRRFPLTVSLASGESTCNDFKKGKTEVVIFGANLQPSKTVQAAISCKHNQDLPPVLMNLF